MNTHTHMFARVPAGAKTFASKVELDHGMSWEEALAARDELVAEAKATGKKLHPRTGFYRSQNTWEPQQGKDSELVLLAYMPNAKAHHTQQSWLMS